MVTTPMASGAPAAACRPRGCRSPSRHHSRVAGPDAGAATLHFRSLRRLAHVQPDPPVFLAINPAVTIGVGDLEEVAGVHVLWEVSPSLGDLVRRLKIPRRRRRLLQILNLVLQVMSKQLQPVGPKTRAVGVLFKDKRGEQHLASRSRLLLILLSCVVVGLTTQIGNGEDLVCHSSESGKLEAFLHHLRSILKRKELEIGDLYKLLCQGLTFAFDELRALQPPTGDLSRGKIRRRLGCCLHLRRMCLMPAEDLEDVGNVFEEMSSCDTVSWTTLLAD